MNNQNKFMIKLITCVVMPDGYTYMSPIIEDNKDACESRYGEMMKDPDWNGYRFIHVPIDVPVPDEVVVKIIQEEDND